MNLPFIDFTSEIYTPRVEQMPHRAMVRNLPRLGEDGIYHHDPECRCGFFCDEDAPDYIPADEVVVVGVA
jgi:hypothetical protein